MEDLTTGSLSRHLMKTASFMLVTMVFQTLYFLVDLYWVGRLGKEAVAAVAIAGNLMFIVLAVTQMLGVGTTALVSHAVGRKDRDTANHVFNQSQVLSVIVGLIFFAAVMSVRGVYAQTLAADQQTAKMAIDYLTWFVPAMSLQFALVAMGAALRGTGNFKPGMVVQTTTVIINIVLAPILMFGWLGATPMGIKGPAIASTVAVAVGIVWLTTYFLPADAFLRFHPSAGSPDLALWKRMLGIGLPAGAEFGLMAVYLLIVYTISRPFGAAAQAGFGIGLRIIQALFMPVVALGFAVAPVAGQNFGAKQSDRVKQTFRDGALMAAGVMVVAAVVCHLVPGQLIGIFSSDPEVQSVGSDYLRISSWNFVASGLIFVASSTFQAMGNTVPALATSFMRLVLVAVPAFIVSRWAGFNLWWIWYLSVGSTLAQMTASLLLLRREFRLRLALAAILTLTAATASAQTVHPQVSLWPNGAPGSESRRQEPEQAKDYRVRNIHDPSITVYLPPKEKASGTGVVVIPGGGHRLLVYNAEGVDPAEYLNSLGVAAFVLKHRLQREEGSTYTIERDAKADAYRAMRTVRSRAAEWGVDPARLGVMGFSAGGEVVGLIAFGSGDGDASAADPIDRLNGRPDFAIFVYPGPLAVQASVPPTAPPAFLVAAGDDPCCSAPTLKLLQQYKDAGVPVEAHIFATGGHGFNMGQRSKLKAVNTWPQRLADWLNDRGLIK